MRLGTIISTREQRANETDSYWAFFPQQVLNHLVLVMERRCQVSSAFKTDHIPCEEPSVCCSSTWADNDLSQHYFFDEAFLLLDSTL